MQVLVQRSSVSRNFLNLDLESQKRLVVENVWRSNDQLFLHLVKNDSIENVIREQIVGVVAVLLEQLGGFHLVRLNTIKLVGMRLLRRTELLVFLKDHATFHPKIHI